MNVLGITFGHDSAACLIADGRIVADAAEERFSRIKHDSAFPAAAISYCLKEGGISSERIDVLAIAGEYLRQGEERYFVLSPNQAAALAAARPIESRARQMIVGGGAQELPLYVDRVALSANCRVVCVDHHLGHAAAAYFTRGRTDRCMIVTMDGIGDDTSIAVWTADGSRIDLVQKWGREASLGWFYGTVTEALGWQHGDGEGKTMGLAPYGDPGSSDARLDVFHPAFSDGQLTRPHDYGRPSFVNDHGVFHWHFPDATRMLPLVEELGRENFAARAQGILERQVVPFIRHWMRELQTNRLCCGGGLFLNVKLNQRVWYELRPEEHWVFPNPGDAGLAMGAALHAWHSLAQPPECHGLRTLAYGPSFAKEEIRGILDARHLQYREVDDPSREAAMLLVDGKIVAWFQGRMESGPRALGHRSILMSAAQGANKDVLNARVKFREGFRPFCPSILSDRKDAYLKGGREENFMMTSFDVTDEKRDAVPAVVHVDGTVRPQTVARDANPRYYDLIQHFGDLTGEYLVLNTSLNIRGEPIACHPRDAISCFFDTGLDALVIDDFILTKAQ